MSKTIRPNNPSWTVTHPDDFNDRVRFHEIGTRGYLDGVSDARHDRTPEHSQTAYRFPREAPATAQAIYNTAYYEAKRDMERARNLNAEWYALQCARCAGQNGFHDVNCEEVQR